MVHKFIKTPIQDLYEIRNDSFSDTRGLFLNAFRIQEPEFKKIWKDRSIKQINLSTTYQKGVVRGLHFQKEPFSEAKIVVGVHGAALTNIMFCKPGQASLVEISFLDGYNYPVGRHKISYIKLNFQSFHFFRIS